LQNRDLVKFLVLHTRTESNIEVHITYFLCVPLLRPLS